MTDKWVVDAQHPGGHLVPMTAAEEAQLVADRQRSAADVAADALTSANASTIRTNLQGRLVQLRQARTALANGTIFATLSVNEKAVMDGLLQDDLYLARLVLGLLDGTS